MTATIDDLPSRGEGAAIERQCPACGTWRLPFLITATPAERAGEVGGVAFVCDVERSRWARHAAAAGLVWNHDAQAWLPDLAAARARQRALINRARDAAQDGGCDVPNVGRFDTGERARQFLNGAVAAAQIALSQQRAFTVDWTLADNSVATLDAAGTIAAGLTVAAHVSAMHQRGRVLKARIDAAETLAEIAAITWSLADPE